MPPHRHRRACTLGRSCTLTRATSTHAVSRVQTTADSPGKSYDKRRKAIRETWLPKVANYPEFEAKFIAGRSEDEDAQAKLVAEQAAMSDFVFLDMKARPPASQSAPAATNACCGYHGKRGARRSVTRACRKRRWRSSRWSRRGTGQSG